MSVAVMTTRSSSLARDLSDTYADGTSFAVLGDGQLAVVDKDGNFIGMYAPGRWLSAYVVGKAEFD